MGQQNLNPLSLEIMLFIQNVDLEKKHSFNFFFEKWLFKTNLALWIVECTILLRELKKFNF